MDGVIKMGCGENSGLKFRGAQGDYDVYEYFKGNRRIFEVAVDRTDPQLEIHVGKVGATFVKVNGLPAGSIGTLFATGLQARRKKHEDRISGDSVVLHFDAHRAFAVLANLYVPKSLADVAGMLDIEPFSDPMPALTDEQVAKAEEKPEL